jgi:hypothetical protein
MVKMYASVIYVFVSTTILMELFVCMLDGKTKGVVLRQGLVNLYVRNRVYGYPVIILHGLYWPVRGYGK